VGELQHLRQVDGVGYQEDEPDSRGDYCDLRSDEGSID
jgi:hypothetical protein